VQLPLGAGRGHLADHRQQRGDADPAGDEEVAGRVEEREVVAGSAGEQRRAFVGVVVDPPRPTPALPLAQDRNPPRLAVVHRAAQRVLAGEPVREHEVDVRAGLPARDGIARRQPELQRHHAVGLGPPGQDHDLALERIPHVELSSRVAPPTTLRSDRPRGNSRMTGTGWPGVLVRLRHSSRNRSGPSGWVARVPSNGIGSFDAEGSVVSTFLPQPYPLFAVVVVAGRPEPYVGRVVGWERTEDDPSNALGPVLTLGARTFVPGVADHVSYEDSREDAERRASALAATVRREDALRVGGPFPEQRSPGDG
jgi:hypothetical protein